MKLLLTSLALAMLVFTGCSQKNPDVDMTSKNVKSADTQMSADTKAKDLSGMDANDATQSGMNQNNMNMGDNANNIAQVISSLENSVNKIYFDFDKYDIRSDMQSKIKSNARLLNSINARDFSIKIEGNCDEWGTDEYNYALGLKRAKSVKEALVSYGVSKDRIMIVSFGESNPVCTDSNKVCWDKNRRAEFKLLP